jgi:hypothetical protein
MTHGAGLADRLDATDRHDPSVQSARAPVRVNSSIAHEVAANFEDARSRPAAPLIAAAYAQLETQTDAIFRRLTDGARRTGIRVAFTRSLVPYNGDQELIDAVRAEQTLEVTTASREPGRHHPLLDCRPGGAYDRFRAVHDILGHARPGLGFDRDGEYTSWLIQDRQYRGLARWALATELHGEHSVRWTSGEIAEHKATLLARDLLRRASRVSADQPLAPRERSG